MAWKKARVQTALLILYLLSCGVLVLRSQDSKMREVGRRDWSSSMPDGEGKGLILASCTQCHSLNSTVSQRKSAAEWERTVRDMVTRGAQIRADEIAAITTYLARHFGPGAALLSPNDGQVETRSVSFSQNQVSKPEDLPEGLGKELMLRACAGCHGLKTVVAQRKDEAGWRSSVRDMVRLGAQLRPNQEPVVVAYLVKHFGAQGAEVTSRSTSGTQTIDSSAMGQNARDLAPPDLSRLLPDGEGKGLILASCVQCHNLRSVVSQRKTAEQWRGTVHDMVERGSQTTFEEAEIMVHYLATHFSKDKKME